MISFVFCSINHTCIINEFLKYFLIHEKECFIKFKTRGTAERFRYDETRLFECIKRLQIRRIVMLNRMQHYIKNTNERDRLYKVSS